ncbi:MAG: Rdx family protein [Planctomycetota bacterium]
MSQVTIKYCRPCGYIRHAESVAAMIRESTGGTVELVPGFFGVFKIWVGDQLVFDKRDSRGLLGKLGFGYLPTPDELADLVVRRLGTERSTKPAAMSSGTRSGE